MERYHMALRAEVAAYARCFSRKMPLDTLFLGGGTPSTYPDHLLLDMFGTLKEVFNFSATAEITIEVNPGTVRPEQLQLWKDIGINRLSIGVQSLKDPVLRKLNRLQSAADVYKALELAQPLFENISIDLIVGLPGVSEDDWKELLHTIVTWPIKHVSVYFLTVHENTQLYFGIKTKKVTLPCDDTVVDLYYWTIDFLAKHHFMQYEISNFAHVGYESRHNQAYWNHVPYKAFGLGACSFDGTRRIQNQKNLMKYLEGVEQHTDITTFAEELTPEQHRLERLMLGLRRSRGMQFEALMDGLSDEQQSVLEKRIADCMEKKLLERKGDRVVLTPTGLAVENEIIVTLSL